MKRNQVPNDIDITQPVELEISLPFQTSTFTVTGDYESVAPIMADYERSTKPTRAPRRTIATNIGNVATKAVEGVRSDVEVLTFDLMNGTHFRKELKERKEMQKKLDYARKLGLI